MIPYILHVTVITTICFLFYKLLLQKETFYQVEQMDPDGLSGRLLRSAAAARSARVQLARQMGGASSAARY